MHSVESFRWFEDPPKKWTRTCGREGGAYPICSSLGRTKFFALFRPQPVGPPWSFRDSGLGQNLVWKLCTLEWKLAWMQNCKSNYVKPNFSRRGKTSAVWMYSQVTSLYLSVHFFHVMQLFICTYIHAHQVWAIKMEPLTLHIYIYMHIEYQNTGLAQTWYQLTSLLQVSPFAE